jgi:hypothetical protein
MASAAVGAQQAVAVHLRVSAPPSVIVNYSATATSGSAVRQW